MTNPAVNMKATKKRRIVLNLGFMFCHYKINYRVVFLLSFLLSSTIQHPVSSIQHPASSIQHPASSIKMQR
jgi:hypothetical protein